MDTAGRILIASSSAESSGELLRAIEFEGHEATAAGSALEVIHEAHSGRYDLLLMDLLVGGAAADTLCRAIRPDAKLGIIVMGGHAASAIDTLNAGADDYVAAPYIVAEVAARVRALLRRVNRTSTKSRSIQLKDRAIDLDSHEIRGPNGSVSRLTPKEFLVLEQLVAHVNQPSTRQHLARTIWQRDGNGEVEYMRIVIKQLRRKLEPNPDDPQYILTERDVGYRLHLPHAEPAAAGQVFREAGRS